MITRILRKEEQWKSDLIQAVCFEFPFDVEKAKKQAQETEKNGDAAKDPVKTECWGCFADDDEQLLGSITVSHFTAGFDGHEVLMGGIGGVSTLPQWRRQRVIRRCFENALEDMYQKGFVLSSLYPFSTNYYRKFGYENNACVWEWTVPFDALPSGNAEGTVEQLFPGDDLSPLLEVYREFYRDYNLAVRRTVYDPALEKENLLEQKRYIYLWRDRNGKPQGFLIAQKTDGDVFDCTTTFRLKNGFLALNAEAYLGLFSFVKTSFSAYYKKIRFQVPEGVRPDSFFPESTEITCQRFYNGMVRIVNVPEALRLCRCKGNGTLRLDVKDEMLSRNSGVWQIDFAPGRENRVTKSEGPADVSLPVSALSALVCGARSSGDLLWMPQVTTGYPEAPLDQVFYRKKCHILELF
ncbi:MAG TPA: GNAT family N-acetyltransferase [Candidatus Fusicatenibacter merdavium]|uniref:GNAT family N-acetyltransferase n=1 Tax=Candidatus Fusicatenibacter merdavium TaxID=2838600 RepID=A0A9D1XFU6_9FIRM|nr:GNAT family N-acetyltransferase [Candidatus Fusicatenibacter merdavium]